MVANNRPNKPVRDLDLDDALRAVGFVASNPANLPEGVTAYTPLKEGDVVKGGPWDGFEVMSVYSRKQAIDDGVLIDVTPLAKKCGFRLHTVITAGVLSEVVGRGKGKGEDEEKDRKYQAAVITTILQELHEAIRKQPGGKDSDTIYFEVGTWKLWAKIGPGDDPRPVLTIMLEGED